MDEAATFDSESIQSNGGAVRGEVDTSAPFESVKEAVTRFGGVGFWKSHHKLPHASKNGIKEESDAATSEEQVMRLANDLVLKERETLEVLKELEATKTVVEELKVKLQKESAKVNLNQLEEPRLMCPSSAPGIILMELKQAKLNLTRTTTDLADIRETVEMYNKKIEQERFELEKTRMRSSSSCSSKISSEVDLPRELHRLTSETEQFKKVGEVAKSQVVRTMNQIKQTRRKIKTANVCLTAATKLKEAARASEALARSEIMSLSKSQTLSEGEEGGVTLSFEEYTSLKLKAQVADEALIIKVKESNVEVNNAELSKSKILNRVEEATEEVKNSKRVLEEALSKVEAANKFKLKAEESLRKWRSDNGQRRKSMVQNSTKFKNSYCSRTNTRLLDVHGAHLGSNMPGPVLRPTMSIGQILSRKLLLTEEYSEKSTVKRKVSLAQMLSKPSNNGAGSGGDGDGGKQRSGKRKKFGFGRISFLVAKPSKKKKKKNSISSRLSFAMD